MRGFHLGATAVAAALALAPPPANAAVTVGSDLANAGTPATCSDSPDVECTVVQTGISDRTLNSRQISSPIDGVVVRWRVRDSVGTLRPRIVRTSYVAYESAGTGDAVHATSAATTTFATRLPIKRGDYVGVDLLSGAALGERPRPGSHDHVFSPPLVDGEPRRSPSASTESEDLYNADIEPDADGDGFGDETQDLCAKDASTHGLCSGPCANSRAGTDGPDTIQGTTAGDLVLARAGADIVSGSLGDDCLSGGDGDDRVSGDAGADVISGDAGNDRVSGGDGADRLDGGPGPDILTGGLGLDIMAGGDGSDTLAGGSGRDRLDGGDGRDRLSGGAGGDTLRGGDGDDVLTGGAGINRLMGGPGNDVLNAANRRIDIVSCGPGRRDRARADAGDRVRGCERVSVAR